MKLLPSTTVKVNVAADGVSGFVIGLVVEEPPVPPPEPVPVPPVVAVPSGPPETDIATAEPAATRLVAAGERTVPAGSVEITVETVPAVRPRAVRSVFASSSRRPATVGTPTITTVLGLTLPAPSTAASANVRVSSPVKGPAPAVAIVEL